jgi:hypothetical protein
LVSGQQNKGISTGRSGRLLSKSHFVEQVVAEERGAEQYLSRVPLVRGAETKRFEVEVGSRREEKRRDGWARGGGIRRGEETR